MSKKAYNDIVEGTYVEPGRDVATEAIAALYDLDTRPGPNAGGSIRHPRPASGEALEALAYIALALEPYMEPQLAQALTTIRRAINAAPPSGPVEEDIIREIEKRRFIEKNTGRYLLTQTQAFDACVAALRASKEKPSGLVEAAEITDEQIQAAASAYTQTAGYAPSTRGICAALRASKEKGNG